MPAEHVADALRIAAAGHRPWPLPDRAWTWRQAWRDLAFLHFPVAPDAIRPKLPPRLTLQTFDGSAWVGLVPFRMCEIQRRDVGPIPCLEPFPELNLRTYVVLEDKPGVWFFSLDADSWPFVIAGRRLYNLPYHKACMRQQRTGNAFHFSSVRRDGDARFDGRYTGVGQPSPAAPGSFEHWVAERYCLYSASPDDVIHRVEVHHAPWPLQAADSDLHRNTILDAAGITPLTHRPVAHFSAGVEVIAYPRERLPLT